MRIHASMLVGALTVAILGVGCDPEYMYYERCYGTDEWGLDYCPSVADQCLTVVNGSDQMCSRDCSDARDRCPPDWMGVPGDCRDIGLEGFHCYQTCRTDSDCLSRFQCLTPGSGGAPICLPGVGGVTAPAYESCIIATCDSTTDGCFRISDSGDETTTICTSHCSVDNDCPFDQRGGRGACLAGICIERCITSNDCNFDAICAERNGRDLPLDALVCVPG